MHIVLVSHYALPHSGGVEVVVDAMARLLTVRGHDVTHVATAATRRDEAEESNVPYHVVRVPAWNALEARGFPFPVPRRGARSEIRRQVAAADVVHAHGMLFLPSALAMRAALRSGHPCRILTEHSGAIGAPSTAERIEIVANHTLGRWTARAAHAVVLINPAIEPLMRALAPQAEIVAIPNGIDLERFRPADRLERERLRAEFGWDARPRVLYVGRVMRRKGAHIAVAAAALAEAGEFELVIVGPGRVEGGARNVTFTGPVTADRVAMFYRAADAFVLPSVREGFPVTVQEALASGLPVIVSEPTVASRLQAAGDRAVRYAPAAAAAVLASIREVLRRVDVDRAAIAAFARTRFDWNRVVDAHLDLYDRVRARSARGRG